MPFLPSVWPKRALCTEDLDWRPLVLPPDPGMQPVTLPAEAVNEIAHLPQVDQTHEFSSGLFPGISFLESGRPALSRLTMLVEHERGRVIHAEFDKGPTPAAEAAVRGLRKALLQAKGRPRQMLITNPRLQPALQPLCHAIGVELIVVDGLPAFEAASKSLAEHLRGHA